MAATRGLYVRVGALVLAAFALGAGFIVFFTAERISGGSALPFETYIRESVQGLDVGAPVRFRGVSIGRVTEIGLAATEYRRPDSQLLSSPFQLVLVRFVVDPERIGTDTPPAADAVRQGLRAKIAAQGITGVYYLELDFVASPDRFPPIDVPWQPKNPYIPTVPSTLSQAQTAAEAILERLRDSDMPGLLTNFGGLLADLRGEFGDQGDLAITLREAAGLLRDLRAVVNGAGVPAMVNEFRGLAAEARGLVASREMRAAIANAGAAAAELRTAAARIPPTLTAFDAGLRTARGAGTDLQAELVPILRDLRAAVQNFRDTTEALRRSPAQAIFGASPPPEPRR